MLTKMKGPKSTEFIFEGLAEGVGRVGVRWHVASGWKEPVRALGQGHNEDKGNL